MTKSEESTRGSKSSPDGSDLERGTISEKDREELAQLNRKIANLIFALEEAGYFQSILDRLLELEIRRNKLLEGLEVPPTGYPSFDWSSDAGVETIARMLGREITREQFEQTESSNGEGSVHDPEEGKDQ